jgi:hypothetical protein
MRLQGTQRQRVAFGVFLTAFILIGSPAQSSTTIDSTNKFAWGENIGWANWEGDVSNGVVVGQAFCSGYIWCENVGWICMGDGSPDDGHEYSNTNATDFGVNVDASCTLRGFAWGENIGWVNFENTGSAAFDPFSGTLSGYAWGENVGWMSLSNIHAFVQTTSLDPGPDTDADMIPDAWELWFTNTLMGMGAGTDSDGDGFTDLEEYGAGTDPLDANSLLEITDIVLSPGTSETDISWSSVEKRLYRIELNTDLLQTTNWVDSGLGNQNPDAGTETTRTVPLGGPTQQFYRVRSIQPL